MLTTDQYTALRIAQDRCKNDKNLDAGDEGDDPEPAQRASNNWLRSNPKGYWVRVWMFVSDEDIYHYDPTPD